MKVWIQTLGAGWLLLVVSACQPTVDPIECVFDSDCADPAFVCNEDLLCVPRP